MEKPKFEPSHEIMELLVLRKLIFQTRMRSHPVGARRLIFGRILRLFPYLVSANSEGSSSEPSLVAYVIITIIPWADSFQLVPDISHSVSFRSYKNLQMTRAGEDSPMNSNLKPFTLLTIKLPAHNWRKSPSPYLTLWLCEDSGERSLPFGRVVMNSNEIKYSKWFSLIDNDWECNNARLQKDYRLRIGSKREFVRRRQIIIIEHESIMALLMLPIYVHVHVIKNVFLPKKSNRKGT